VAIFIIDSPSFELMSYLSHNYYQDGELYYSAKVRNGFVPHNRCEVAAKLKGLEIDACPFANLPERKRTQWALTREEMKNCIWIKPELVAQSSFREPPSAVLIEHRSQTSRPRTACRQRIRRATI